MYHAQTDAIIMESMPIPAGITSFHIFPNRKISPTIIKNVSIISSPYIYIIASLGYVSTGFGQKKALVNQ